MSCLPWRRQLLCFDYTPKCGTLTWPNDQMAERPNRPIWSCPLFDVKRTILKYYQNYGRY